jgi:CheY-like chemotaxis protein
VNGEIAMMPQTERISRRDTSAGNAYRPVPRVRTVAVVSRNPDQQVLGAVMCAVDHDVVLVEPTDHAYSHIKRIRPDLVIVCLSGDDIDGCRVLSMLALDRETSTIPVLTHLTSLADGFTEPSDSSGDDIGSMATVVLN